MNNERYNQLQVELSDNAEHQIDHCFREHEGQLLKLKLIELMSEWLWKGFNEGYAHAEETREDWISLDHPDFKDLVAGGVVTKRKTRIVLKDIGYTTMLDCIDASMRCGDILEGEKLVPKSTLADLHQKEI